MSAVVVIIVNYDSGEYLAPCLASVLAQEPPAARVIVVDNASPQPPSAEELPSGVEFLRRPRNGGFAAAVLTGLAHSTEPFVLTLNPDTELQPGCLRAALRPFESDAAVGSVAPLVLQSAAPERIDARGLGLNRHFGALNWDHGDAASEPGPSEVLGPLGGAALWRRSALERAGGFDPFHFLYWEDTDLSLRLLRAGYRCACAPEARVLHAGSGTVGRDSALNAFCMVRNQWSALMLGLPWSTILSHPVRFKLAPLRTAALYARRGRGFVAFLGLLAGALRVPVAFLRRRRLKPRPGYDTRKTAGRLQALVDAAEASRTRMKLRDERAP
ncbi:MAG: hypothetical protein DHS20C15_16770 [Planctomycetota bacterium]|nr:MAG: hypothetical protein DHS20C15_16770 [Planctomycetota bacterium]